MIKLNEIFKSGFETFLIETSVWKTTDSKTIKYQVEWVKLVSVGPCDGYHNIHTSEEQDFDLMKDIYPNQMNVIDFKIKSNIEKAFLGMQIVKETHKYRDVR